MSPTFFELTTALAWLWFERQRADISVVEVGLGGRLDSTNVCRPEVCVLTTVSRDHMHVLGSRLSEIAAEKAGIIKSGVPVVSGVLAPEAQAVIADMAAERGARLHCVDMVTERDSMIAGGRDLSGRHQQHNVAVAVAAVHALRERGWRVDDQAIQDGLRRVRCPVRIEVVSQEPLVVLDAAHNWASAGAVLETLAAHVVSGRRVLIFATSRDKDVPGLLRRLLCGFDCVVLTEFQSNPRAMPLEQLEQAVRRMTSLPVHSAVTPHEAWDAATRLCSRDGMICVAGSFFVAAELRVIATKKADPFEPAEVSD